MITDMLVKLYDLPDHCDLADLQRQAVHVKRALSVDKDKILKFIGDFHEPWAGECEAAFANKPVSCFIAVKDRQIIGFACYNATCLGFFGPTGVSPGYRKNGIGKTLLLKSLLAMREEGYAYAVIGYVDEAREYYEKTVNAVAIEGSFPGVYRRMIDYD
jgi:GNAT superfamily N-acetyltransferase